MAKNEKLNATVAYKASMLNVLLAEIHAAKKREHDVIEAKQQAEITALWNSVDHAEMVKKAKQLDDAIAAAQDAWKAYITECEKKGAYVYKSGSGYSNEKPSIMAQISSSVTMPIQQKYNEMRTDWEAFINKAKEEFFGSALQGEVSALLERIRKLP